jgi:hypothetical protein
MSGQEKQPWAARVRETHSRGRQVVAMSRLCIFKTGAETLMHAKAAIMLYTSDDG